MLEFSEEEKKEEGLAKDPDLKMGWDGHNLTQEVA